MSFRKIGNILKPFGLEGRLIIRLDIVDKGFLCSLKNMYWGFGSEPEHVDEITFFDVKPRQVVLGLQNVQTRTDAEKLQNAFLFIPESDFRDDTDTDTILNDILTCLICDADGNVLGEPLRIESYPAQDMLILLRKGQEVMIPLAEDFILDFNLTNKRIVLDLPEGLLNED
jgi:16S rRNA processing protein RimM